MPVAVIVFPLPMPLYKTPNKPASTVIILAIIFRTMSIAVFIRTIFEELKLL